MPTAPSSSIFDRREQREATRTTKRSNINDHNARDTQRGDMAKRSAADLANPPFWYSFGTFLSLRTAHNIDLIISLPPRWHINTMDADYGMAHIVVFNTETDFGNGLVGPEELGGSTGLDNGPFGTTINEQIEFLEKDLAAVDRRITR